NAASSRKRFMGSPCCGRKRKGEPGRASVVDAANRLDDDLVYRGLSSDLDLADLVHDVHAVDDLAEDAVAVAVGGPALVEGVVVGVVDVELGGGAVRVLGAGHGQGAAQVLQVVE